MTTPERPAAPASRADEPIAFGPFLLSRRTRALLREGAPQSLGGRAFDVLLALAERAGEVVETEALLARVWPTTVVDPGGLRVHITGLRKVLGARPDGSPWIENVPGRGYRLAVPRDDAGRVSPGPDAAAAPPADDYLPFRLAASVGRGEVVDALVGKLGEHRLVTVVGPGGIGKTTVALDAARRMAGACRDGVRFVDLAALNDASLIASAIAQAIGVALVGSDPAASLVAYLRPSRMLVVLDSCELVVDAAAVLAERLLQAAPGLVLLATSREPLRIRAECVLQLGPLEVPPDAGPIAADAVTHYSALALFMERAAAAGGLLLGSDDVAVLAQLCRKLDGNPLAIELAAARVGMFGLRPLVALIDERLSLLARGRGSLPARHQTLTATLDWSYRTLSPTERAILRRLSVFRSRFNVVSAAAVACFDPVDESAVFDGVEGLVSKSLIVADNAGGSPHFRLLDTTRAYATEKLADGGDGPAAALRHAEACRQLLEDANEELATQTPVQWSLAHGHLIEDVRAALRWAFGAAGDVGAGVRLTAASGPLWILLSRSVEFIEHIERALRHLDGLDGARALEMALSLSLAQCHLTAGGPTPATFAAFEHAGDLARAEGKTRMQLISLYGGLSSAYLLGHNEDALRFAEEFGAVAQAAGYTSATLMHHRSMAMVFYQAGRFEESLAHIRIVMDAHPERFHFFLDSQVQLEHHGASLTHLAKALWVTGRTREAREAARQAVDVSVAFDHPITIVYALTMAACPIALWCGDWALACDYIDRLADWAERHSLVFWSDWAALLRRALAWCEPGADPEEGAESPDWLAAATQMGSRADTLATFCPGLACEAALERALHGPETWCTAELLRVRAGLVLRSQAGDASSRAAEAQALLLRSLAMSARQQARAWELRASVSLAQLRTAQGRPGEARELLQGVLARLDVDPDVAIDPAAGKDVARAVQAWRALHADDEPLVAGWHNSF